MIIQQKGQLDSSDYICTESTWRTMDGGLWYCTGDSDQDHPQEKEMQKGKMVI